jgi:DNA-binding XRE family transcriptional regulator
VDPGRSLPDEGAVFSWSRKLDQAERKELKGGNGYIQGWTSVLPHFDAAAELTDAERRLLDFINREITLNKDGAADKAKRYKRTAQGADEPRIYRRDFCPLLDEGKDYNAALGHFRQNPESGRKLTAGGGRRPSASSGGHPEGLLDVLGLGLTRGPAANTVNPAVVDDALEAMRRVVEVELGGRVAVRRVGRWLTLDEAALLHVQDLTKDARFLLFVAADWQDRIHRRIEEAGRDRGFDLRLTRDREVKAASEAQRQAAALPAPEAEDQAQGADAGTGLDVAELRVRLHAGRKRAGKTVREAADNLNVSGKTISLWERGKQPIPPDRVEALETWLRAIGGPGPWNVGNG